MGIILSRNDQIRVLRETNDYLVEREKYLDKIEWDADLEYHAETLSSYCNSAVHDADVGDIKTDDEVLEDAENLAGEIHHREMCRAHYHNCLV